MFLRKEVKRIKTGSYTLIPFCKDCDSEDIEIIKTCKHCGSHNIGNPTTFDLLSDDKKGVKPVYEDKNYYVYKCDKCGKEFGKYIDLLKSNIISYAYGEFIYGAVEDSEKVIPLNEDLCEDCINKLISKLNKQLNEVTEQENVLNTLNKL